MALSDTGLLVRYPFKDAASGSAPTFVEDVGPNGYDLTDLNYGSGNLAFSEPAANRRGLTSAANTGTQRANYPIGASGDAVRTAVSGATQLVWELVANYTSGSGSTGRLAAIQHRTSGAAPAFGLTVVGTTLTPYINSTAGAATANLSAAGRVVIHLVYDSTQAADADRLKLYVDGVLTSFSGSGIDLNETIAIVGDHDIVHFNRNSGGSYDRSVTGTLHYSALYSGTFDQTRIDAHVAELATNDDTPGGGDTTAPVLTSAVGTATGSTTATVGATTDEANGTLYVVVTTSNTQPSIAQIKAGQDHTGAAAAYASSQAVSTTGAKTFSATGLAASTTYYAHLVHADAAANDSNRITSSSFTTDTPDTTAPTLTSGVGTVESNALIVVGATTDEANGTMYAVLTTSATPPSATQVRNGQDHTGAAAVFAANQAIGSTGAKTFNATGLTQLTAYYPYIVHRDAAGNDSSVLSIGARTTFRDGATGQAVIDNTGPVGDNPAGIMYNDVVLPGDADKWFSYRIVSGPTTPGDFEFNADGSFSYSGTAGDSFDYQLEVDGVDTGSPQTVTLSATENTATPENAAYGHSSTESAVTQTNISTPENASYGHSATENTATEEASALPENAAYGHSSTEAAVTQTNTVTPENAAYGHSATENTVAEIPASTGGKGGCLGVGIGVGLSL